MIAQSERIVSQRPKVSRSIKVATFAFLALWVLAQVGAAFALVNNSAPQLYGSIALAWIGGAGMAVCIILRKRRSLAWLVPVLAVWALPIPLAMAGIEIPSSVGIMFWIGGLAIASGLPDKTMSGAREA